MNLGQGMCQPEKPSLVAELQATIKEIRQHCFDNKDRLLRLKDTLLGSPATKEPDAAPPTAREGAMGHLQDDAEGIIPVLIETAVIISKLERL